MLSVRGNISQMGMVSPAIRNTGKRLASLDEELLAQIRQGDRSALVEVYDRYQAPVYQFALAMSGDQSIAADITQDVFLLMLEPTGPFRGVFSGFDPEKGALEGYLLGVARKLTRKAMRKQSRWQPIAEDVHSEIAFAEGSESKLEAKVESKIDAARSLERLRSAIELLPVKYREAIVLCCLQERSYDQAAAIIGRSAGTVASRLSRARKLLSQRLASPGRVSSREHLGRERLAHILRRRARHDG